MIRPFALEETGGSALNVVFYGETGFTEAELGPEHKGCGLGGMVWPLLGLGRMVILGTGRDGVCRV